MNNERIKELFADEEFINKLLEQEEPEQVQEVFASKDIDISVEEIKKIRELLEKHANKAINLEELSEDELEDVTGGMVGFVIGTCLLIAGAAGVGLVGSAAIVTNACTRRRW